MASGIDYHRCSCTDQDMFVLNSFSLLVKKNLPTYLIWFKKYSQQLRDETASMSKINLHSDRQIYI